jgi:4-diphosphocytidyl-2-C-methyl-D-erythritol kinase
MRSVSGPVTARAPGKVNIQLSVGRIRGDGYHPLATVFHAVNLDERVTATPGAPGSGVRITSITAATGIDISGVPRDGTNLVAKAAYALAAAFDVPADVDLAIEKAIPVAGGMAGGSADCAAALVALNAAWRLGATPAQLAAVGAQLGSDVPFALLGGTAAGLGRGEHLSTLMTRGRFHWVFATSSQGLSTPAVYGKNDELIAQRRVPEPVISAEVTAALIAGDARRLARAMSNDLQEPALVLRPGLRRVIEAGLDANALAGLVSGSGPTVAFLVADEERSVDLAIALAGSGAVSAVFRAWGPAPGARLIDPEPGRPSGRSSLS